MFLVNLPVRTVRKCLARSGFTPQCPIKRAYEQRPEAVEKWLKAASPAIVASSKAEDAEISWAENGCQQRGTHLARLRPAWQYASMSLSQSKCCRINLIYAVPNQGMMRFMRYRETLDADMFIKFLTRLDKEAGKKDFLIVHNLRVHHAKVVMA